MVTPFLTELRSMLSFDRLERYRPAGGSDLEMISTYFWNIEICETLYQTLGALEMALRNSIGNTLTQEFGRPDWYDEPGFLQKREAVDVFGAKFDLEREGKQITPGRIVARQTFGFWTSLISGGYKVWTANNHAAIKIAFPHAPVHMHYRSRAFDQMNMLRMFRNRVFHYESVLDGITLQNGAQIPLPQIHSDIIGAIGWMNPTFQASIQAFDRFPSVYAGQAAAVENRVKQHLGIP